MKYNNDIKKIRDRLGKIDEPAEQEVAESTETAQPSEVQSTAPDQESKHLQPKMLSHMQTFYGRLLFLDTPSLGKEILEGTDIPRTALYDIVSNLEGMGLIASEPTNLRGNPKRFSINTATPIPEGWPTAEEMKSITPLVRPPTDDSEDRVTKEAQDNPLTKMLMNWDKSPFEVEGYKQFIEDTKKFYNIKELDDCIKVLHKICQQRILNQRIYCPLCGKAMVRNASEIHCKACDIKLDAGTFERSMELMSMWKGKGVVE